MSHDSKKADTSPHNTAPSTTAELGDLLARLEQIQQELRLRLLATNGAAEPRTSKPIDPQGAILGALKEHGKRTTQQLEKDCGLTKPQVHYHVGVLEQQGQAVTVRGVRNAEGRRGPDVVYHADAIAI